MGTKYRYGLTELYSKDALETKMKKKVITRLWRKILSTLYYGRLGIVMQRENQFQAPTRYNIQCILILSLIFIFTLTSLNILMYLKIIDIAKG